MKYSYEKNQNENDQKCCKANQEKYKTMLGSRNR